MMNTIVDSTVSHAKIYISRNIPLHDKNWFRTGGTASYWLEPSTSEEFAQGLQYARTHGLPLFVLGEGANSLINDAGFNGLVIRPQLKNITMHSNNGNSYVTVGAGVSFNTLIEACLEHNMLGLHEFSGIPGTVGGSVFINLHYFEFLLSQFLVKAQVIERSTGFIYTVDNAWFNFGYNTSTLNKGEYYLLEATFSVVPATAEETAYARGRRYEIIRYRSRQYPTQGTCGSFFRNFHSHEVTLEIAGKKMIHVAYYLDKLGIKGSLSVGGARVSHQHVNMLVTSDGATSHDIITLVRTIQERMFEQYGIIPQPECLLVGFDTYPLL